MLLRRQDYFYENILFMALRIKNDGKINYKDYF